MIMEAFDVAYSLATSRMVLASIYAAMLVAIALMAGYGALAPIIYLDVH